MGVENVAVKQGRGSGGVTLNALTEFVRRASLYLNIVAAVALSLMMFLTVLDVILRATGKPIVGTYEIVSLLMAVVIGFAIPRVSIDKAHVYMEIGIDRMSARNQRIMNTFTRVLCFVLFFFIGYNLIMVGSEFHASGEVSPTLRLPFFPVAYGVGVCCFLECLVFVLEIVKTWRGSHE
jgi:TRAP-type C4-dicarboxylate transport system permease small subunit